MAMAWHPWIDHTYDVRIVSSHYVSPYNVLSCTISKILTSSRDPNHAWGQFISQRLILATFNHNSSIHFKDKKGDPKLTLGWSGFVVGH